MKIISERETVDKENGVFVSGDKVKDSISGESAMKNIDNLNFFNLSGDIDKRRKNIF